MRWLFLLLTISFSASYGQSSFPLSYENYRGIPYLGNYHTTKTFTQKKSGASQNFKVSHYLCNWEIDPAQQYIKGNVGISFRTTQSTSEIILDLNDVLTVDSILYQSNRLSYIHNSNVIKIQFGNELSAEEQNLVTVYYHGSPPRTGYGSFVSSTHAGVPVLWTLSEPYGSRDWWPCKDGLQDKADSLDVFITTPDKYTSVSNGLRIGNTVNNGSRTTHWKHRYPISTYLVCMAATNYSEFVNEWDVPGGPLMMQTFCYRENQAIFEQETPRAYQAMRFFSGLVEPYPFLREKYGHVQFGFGGGEEHQTSTFIFWPQESLMAHEMAHQWFGDKVTCGSWQDIWLNEGFASQMASMYMEQTYPSTVISTRKAEIERITSLPGGSVFVDDTTSVSRIFDNRLTYLKGSHLLYMLRLIMGDSSFFRGVRTYLNDPGLSYGFAKTSDLQKHLEDSYGQSLEYFFKEWFYGQGYPSFHLDWWKQREGVLGLRISQVTSHPSVSFFHLPLPIRLFAGVQATDITLYPNFNEQIFYVNNSFLPDSLSIDPEYWLITKGNSISKIDKPEKQTTISIFPNPASDKVRLRANGLEGNTLQLLLMDMNGRLIQKQIIKFNGSVDHLINIERIASGIYVLKASTDAGFKKVFRIRKGL